MVNAMTDPVTTAHEGAIATITLNRPDALNALDLALVHTLRDAAVSAAADVAVRCIVLTGAGRAFCAGGDIREFTANASRIGAHVRALSTAMHEAQIALIRAPKPVVVAVNGAAAGGGFGLALSGDIVIAAESARFTSAYAKIAAAPDGGFSFLVPRVIGLRRAQDLFFTDRTLTAAEARDVGLITRVVPDADLTKETMELATHLAAGPTTSYALAKELFAASLGQQLEAHLERESLAITAASQTEDFASATKAFLERRPPEFRGR
jgi:2-(1,2-epoxy-1,2-dihydrophenyl)acetyl-CoA isomerase